MIKSKQEAYASVYKALERATSDDQTKEISVDANLVVDIGLDSLEIATFLIAVEEECGVTLPDGIESNPITIRLIAEEALRLTNNN